MNHLYRLIILVCVVSCGFYLSGKAQDCNVIYVTPGGASSGNAGTRQNPASLTYGLSLVSGTANVLYMRAGTYNISNPVNLVSNVKIYGGFNTQWRKTNGSESIIFRDFTNVQSNPSRLVALQGNGITNFELHDITVKTANAVGTGISTYGIYLGNCSAYELVRVRIQAGTATGGLSGLSGNNGIAGAAGVPGQNGDEDGPCCNLGGAPGSGSFPGSNPGGAGGNGGPRGTYSFPIGGSAPPGTAGNSAPGSGGGLPGLGGVGVDDRIISLSACARTTMNDGTSGTPGTPGVQGIPGPDGVASFTGGWFQPASGVNGTPGTNGFGGGGGGGGGSQGYVVVIPAIPGITGEINSNGTGAGGGGGGEGGQGGTGGGGGGGGGASFGLFVWNNGPGGIIKDCYFQTGQFGLGGNGGLGGAGGLGGVGGAGGGQLNCDIGAGGNGGNGGNGGSGGKGGLGSDGVSMSLYQNGTPLSIQNINNLQQPIVTVEYSGCINAPVKFSTNQTGTIQWFFGAASQPATFFGQTATAYYTATGEKTFTMVWNGIAYTYTEFLNIINGSAPPIPQIVSTDTVLCVGATGTFSSSISADSYEWQITGGSSGVNQTIIGPSNQQISFTFTQPGNYQVYLQTVDNCCGRSFRDSFDVFIDGLIQPSIAIQSIIENNGFNVCQGANVIFTATAANVANQPGYQWFLNGNPVGTGTSTLVLNSPAQGDQVSCQVTSDLGCSTGLTALSNIISINVIETPVISCSSTPGFANEPSFFDATVVSGGLAPFTYTWNFGNNSFGSGDTVATVYPVAGSYNVQVDVTDANGCTGVCNLAVLVENFLSVNFNTGGTFNGCAPLPVSFFNESVNAITYLWDFGDGTTSNQANPVHVYTSPGIYDVTLSGFSQVGNLSASVTSQIAVFPRPVANFSAYPQVVGEAGQTVYFTDNSADAWTWNWNFGDPSSGAANTSNIQNPTHVYSANGNYTVTLVVTNNYGCADTTVKNGFAQVHVGVDEHAPEINIIVFPNPFAESFYIRTSQVPGEISLKDVSGKQIPLQMGNYSGTDMLISPDYRIAPGVYILQVDGQIFKLIAQ